jgi:hypothetical protein
MVEKNSREKTFSGQQLKTKMGGFCESRTQKTFGANSKNPRATQNRKEKLGHKKTNKA